MFAQFILGTLALGNVMTNAKHADRHPTAIEQRYPGDFQQLLMAVGESNPVLGDDLAGRRQCQAMRRAQMLSHFRRHEIGIGMADQLCLAPAGETLKTRVARQVNAFGIFHPHQIGQILDQAAQLGVRIFQFRRVARDVGLTVTQLDFAGDHGLDQAIERRQQFGNLVIALHRQGDWQLARFGK